MSTTPVQSDAHLARLLNIDRAMVSRLKKRGMPTGSLEAAQTWRQHNLNPAQRKDSNSARAWHHTRSGTPAAARAALARVHGLANLALEAVNVGRFGLVEAELREALRAVPSDARDGVQLDVRVWDALTAWVSGHLDGSAAGAPAGDASPSDAAHGSTPGSGVSALWYAIAADEDIELGGE